MTLISRFRVWWREQTGEEQSPLDGDTPTFAVSLVFHLVLLFVLAFIPVRYDDTQVSLTLDAPPEEEEMLELPDEVYFSEQPAEQTGANSSEAQDMALSVAQQVSDVSQIPTPTDIPVTEVANVNLNNEIQVATGLHFDKNLQVKGAAGVGTTGASGAIDRITHEILLSLEERKTLVVWMFDESGSLTRQRREINDRFAKIYEELGVIEASGNPAFDKHDNKPLLTHIMSFGQQVRHLLEKPTDDLAKIQEAVEGVEQDDSGTEMVFSSVLEAADRFKNLRKPDPDTREPYRNVMLIVVTDERGDDYQAKLDAAVKLCRNYAMPVYVVGVPAPFGREETLVKWVDPDPEYDQTPQWGRVNQGPESLRPERIQLSFSLADQGDAPIDSGFGPFALTRLCYETGGIYFAVHPNRNVNRDVRRGEVEAFSAHLERFFDPQVMRRYRPDYVSISEYDQRLRRNKARMALVQAADKSWLETMENPRTRFVKTSEAELANALSEAQRTAAKLEPKIDQLYQTLKIGETDRENETTPRWQAGYDLAMGRVLAAKVRTETYNAMLAAAKRGMEFEDKKNNTWVLKPADNIEVGSQLERMGEQAKMYLNRVVEEHPDTPWALLAQRELSTPVGWEWSEKYTDLSPRNGGMAGGNNNNRNDERNMLKRKPKRKVPKL